MDSVLADLDLSNAASIPKDVVIADRTTQTPEQSKPHEVRTMEKKDKKDKKKEKKRKSEQVPAGLLDEDLDIPKKEKKRKHDGANADGGKKKKKSKSE